MNKINLNKKLCPLCEAEAKENNIVDIVENIWENNKNVYECSNCKLYFIDEPSQSEIEFLYNSDFYARNNNIIYKFIDAKMKYARALNRFNYIKKFIKKTDNLNVLEIGASDGLLLSIFKKENFNVFGYELNENARKDALKKYDIKMKDDFLKDKNIDKNKYNIVIMSHILEHFTNPKYILNSVHNFIGGGVNDILFIEIPYTPNYKIVSKDEMKIFFETEHTVHFNEKNISLLMKECNFKILDICYNEYNINDNNLKKNIWLGKFDFKSSINFLYFISKICFNPKKAFIDYKISDNFNFGRNIRIIAAKNN
ncbi:class I SAM-dependent methyltransferase [Brachyspira aalborgi]|uniref:Class I SAM-dependent methyltransferase n=1 Tax=Brachyspira aalborgi TaxID=29522 RepID=A0A5C8EPW6_9SPIR|nr:class I SAM-dependent methyltransferase [Brachyspira aalborgi]TXJ38792.1 class I SAM-dependent methyltransferase [Brachyspira aalborgi]